MASNSLQSNDINSGETNLNSPSNEDVVDKVNSNLQSIENIIDKKKQPFIITKDEFKQLNEYSSYNEDDYIFINIFNEDFTEENLGKLTEWIISGQNKIYLKENYIFGNVLGYGYKYKRYEEEYLNNSDNDNNKSEINKKESKKYGPYNVDINPNWWNCSFSKGFNIIHNGEGFPITKTNLTSYYIKRMNYFSGHSFNYDSFGFPEEEEEELEEELEFIRSNKYIQFCALAANDNETCSFVEETIASCIGNAACDTPFTSTTDNSYYNWKSRFSIYFLDISDIEKIYENDRTSSLCNNVLVYGDSSDRSVYNRILTISKGIVFSGLIHGSVTFFFPNWKRSNTMNENEKIKYFNTFCGDDSIFNKFIGGHFVTVMQYCQRKINPTKFPYKYFGYTHKFNSNEYQAAFSDSISDKEWNDFTTAKLDLQTNWGTVYDPDITVSSTCRDFVNVQDYMTAIHAIALSVGSILTPWGEKTNFSFKNQSDSIHISPYVSISHCYCWIRCAMLLHIYGVYNGCFCYYNSSRMTTIDSNKLFDNKLLNWSNYLFGSLTNYITKTIGSLENWEILERCGGSLLYQITENFSNVGRYIPLKFGNDYVKFNCLAFLSDRISFSDDNAFIRENLFDELVPGVSDLNLKEDSSENKKEKNSDVLYYTEYLPISMWWHNDYFGDPVERKINISRIYNNDNITEYDNKLEYYYLKTSSHVGSISYSSYCGDKHLIIKARNLLPNCSIVRYSIPRYWRWLLLKKIFLFYNVRQCFFNSKESTNNDYPLLESDQTIYLGEKTLENTPWDDF
ncbi:hypothetical protein PIROE2DRAFT_68786 [Piromyces sp. E2]|nr:hypothetical protein PIROE2DRAFT_68786 [Piromyces sp. E2]|eukprot:OUM67782.1 hypothetical protein PIROE2DRAFT_68786 [Piromyces sp. E2]